MGENFERNTSVGQSTNGGRRFVIAAGDYNIPADVLGGSGILGAMGLTLIRPEGNMNTCSSGGGLFIDYVLVTSRFAPAIVSVEAVRDVPSGSTLRPTCKIQI